MALWATNLPPMTQGLATLHGKDEALGSSLEILQSLAYEEKGRPPVDKVSKALADVASSYQAPSARESIDFAEMLCNQDWNQD